MLASLAALAGADEASRLWQAARQRAGVAGDGQALSGADLEYVLQQLVQRKGVAAVAAMSMLVRLRSYRALALENEEDND